MSDFFNLTIEGIGYLSQIDLKTINNEKQVLVCRVAALRGSTERIDYTYFECRVVGKKAKQLIQRLKVSSEAKQKILVSFVLSDCQAKPFLFESGKHKGQPGVYLNVRLLKLRWVKIGQEEVYREQPKQVITQSRESIPESVVD